MFWDAFLEDSWIGFFGRAFIPAPSMPKGGMPLEKVPFLVVSNRNSIADITAEGLMIGVVRSADETAVYRRNRLVKMTVEATEVKLGGAHRDIVSGLVKFLVCQTSHAGISTIKNTPLRR